MMEGNSMGEAAEMMMEGFFCQSCSDINPEILETGRIPDFPYICEVCESEERRNAIIDEFYRTEEGKT